MWTQFLLQNAHFALSLFAALVFFAVFWLYFDAWLAKKSIKESWKLFGFLFVCLSFVAHAAVVESSILDTSIGSSALFSGIRLGLRLIGYLFIIIGLLQERVEPRPKGSTESAAQVLPFGLVLPFSLTLFDATHFLLPIFTLIIALLYARKAFPGLEHHLRSMTFAFGLLTISEILSLSELFRNTTNIDVYTLVSPFGMFWIIEHVVLFSICILLGKWVFGYLLKQFQPQLFFIINTMILIIFLITTVSFSGLLLKNIQDENIRQLESDVRVLQFSIEGKQNESKSDAALIASDPQVIAALSAKDRVILNTVSESFLVTRKLSQLAIFDASGQVLSRGEDKEKIGDSISSNLLVKRVLRGETAASLESKAGVLSPQLIVNGAAPIEENGVVIGGVILGTSIDNVFVDGIKKATSLEATIYGGNSISATTLLASDEKTRLLGITEENDTILRPVLTEGVNYSGPVDISNTPFYASFSPLKDVEGAPLGMISVARTQVGVLQTAGRSIELTFIVAIIMLLLAVLPSFLISRYMANQL